MKFIYYFYKIRAVKNWGNRKWHFKINLFRFDNSGEKCKIKRVYLSLFPVYYFKKNLFTKENTYLKRNGDSYER